MVNAVVIVTADPHKVTGAKAQLMRTGLRRVIQTNVLSRGEHNSLIRENVFHSCISWQVGAEARSVRSPEDETATEGLVDEGVNVCNADEDLRCAD